MSLDSTPAETRPRRLIVGMTGATGSIFAIRMLEALRRTDVESHLVISRWGARTMMHETDRTLDEVRALATHAYKEGDQGARISSGSFVTLGMVIVPCSMKTLADIAHGHSTDLVNRAADVVLKERRRLVLAVREAPFTDIHLENMLKLSRMGVIISPPVPAFYNRPKSIDDIVDHTVARLLDLFGIEVENAKRWTGKLELPPPPPTQAARAADATPAAPHAATKPPTSTAPLRTSPRRRPGPSANGPLKPATENPRAAAKPTRAGAKRRSTEAKPRRIR